MVRLPSTKLRTSRSPQVGVKILQEGFTFDDVLIRPGASSMEPAEASLTTKIAGVELSVPFLSAAMDRVTEVKMAVALGKLGGLGVLHRNCSVQEQAAMVREVKSSGGGSASGGKAIPVAAACGPFAADRAKALDEAGADAIVFHYEACSDLHEARSILKSIKKMGKMPGISVKPATPVAEIFPLIEEKLVEYALVMTVEPGFGGQKFMEDSARKIWELSKLANRLDLKTWIGVDGGITEETAKTARDFGANLLVSGTAIFKEKTRKGMGGVMERLRG